MDDGLLELLVCTLSGEREDSHEEEFDGYQAVLRQVGLVALAPMISAKRI